MPRARASRQPDNSPKRSSAKSLWPQVLLFALTFGALYAAWSQASSTYVEKLLIADVTVAPAAYWIQLLTPSVGATAHGFSIRALGGGINVLNGCEGLDMLFLFWSALVAGQMGWRRRIVGLVVGSLLIWALNQVRVVGLFYANRVDKDLFTMLHGTIAPLLLIICITLIFTSLLTWQSGAQAVKAGV